VLERRLHLRAVVARIAELGTLDHGLHRLAQIAARREKALRHAVDERRRRRIGDQALAELRREELRGRRMAREKADHRLPFLDSAAGAEALSEDELRLAVVEKTAEREARVAAIDAPAGEHACKLGDVLLRVAAIDAERVQLHQLARIVLVD